MEKTRDVEQDCPAIACQVVPTNSVEGASEPSGIAFGLDAGGPDYPFLSITLFADGQQPLTAVLTPADVVGMLQIIMHFGQQLGALAAAMPGEDGAH